MSWFTSDFAAFLSELEANNNRDWFNAQKGRYEKSVKEPFEAFVEELITRMQKLNPAIRITAKEAVFRIARDTRFSKDKTPYKTHMAAIISPGGRKHLADPGLYVQLNAEGVQLYTGVYEPDKDALHRIREEIADKGKKFSSLITAAEFRKHWGEMQGEKNKRIPKELEEAAAIQPLIYNKQFYFGAVFKPDWLTRQKLPETLVEYYRIAMPVIEFFRKPMAG